MISHNRVRLLKEEPYTQKEAETAIGLRTDNGERLHAWDSPADDMEALAQSMDLDDPEPRISQ